jgi:hypothetical protein
MPSGYTIDLPRSLVITRAWGVLIEEDLFGHAAALGADPRFRRDMRQLLDFREVTQLQISGATLRQMVDRNPFGAGARRAIVVGSEVAYGMARMFQTFKDATPDRLEVFRSLERALEWLGLTDSAADVRATLTAVRPLAAPSP